MERPQTTEADATFFFGGIEHAGNNRCTQSILKTRLGVHYPAAT